ATKVAAGKVTKAVTQKTLQSKEDTGNKNNNDKDGNDDEDDNDDNDNNAAIYVDSSSLDAKILKLLHNIAPVPMSLSNKTK
ncbi:hypothetical protein C0995_008177, partial [Termitomyces sp. Mi166